MNIIFLCVLMVFAGNSMGYAQSSSDTSPGDENADTESSEDTLVRMAPGYEHHSYYGTRTKLFFAGGIVTSLGLLVELGAFMSVAFTPTDGTSLHPLYADLGMLNFLFIGGGALITAGAASMLSGIMYIDDSIDNRAKWRKDQLFIGIIESSVGAVLATTGGILLGISNDDNVIITSKVFIGTGSAAASMGIVHTLVGLFAP